MGRRADYEGRILKSLILLPEENYHKVLYSLNIDDFSSSQWRKFYSTISEHPLDNPTTQKILDILSENSCKGEILLDSNQGTYGVDEIDNPIKKVKNRSTLKKTKRILEFKASKASKVSTDSKKLLTDLIVQVTNLYNEEKKVTLQDQVDEMIANSKKYEGKNRFGVSTGLETVDWYTKGMQYSHLWVMGGYTSVGKSWIALNFARQWLLENKHVFYISLEMHSEDILWRLVAKEANLPINVCKSKRGLSKKQRKELDRIIELIRKYDLTINDSLMDWEEILFSILYQIHAKNTKCIVIDYIQNVLVSSAKSEYESINIVIRKLQRIAVKNDVFILTMSQVSRSSMNGSDKTFGFKGSGNIENAADVAVVLNAPEKDQLVIDVKKNRQGITGSVLCKTDLAQGKVEDEGKYESSF